MMQNPFTWRAIGSLLLAVLLTQSVLSQSPAFPLRVSDNKRYFVDGQGKPFLYQADTGWQLFARLTLAEARQYLVTRKSQGFTAIQVMFSINPDSANRQGDKPFANYDFSRPNEAYFSHAERVVQLADSLGLLFNIAPFWTGCCREGYGVGAKVEMYARNGTDKTRRLGEWLGKRFNRYSNLFWTVGGDNDPLSIRKEIEALAEGIKATAPRHLVTFHARPPHSSTDLFQYAPWLDFSMVYTYWREKPNDYVNPEQMPEVYEVAHREHLKSDKMPFILGESQYEGSGKVYANDMGQPHHIRRQAYWTMLSGGAGHAYGHDGWFFPDHWREILQYPGAGQLGHLMRFFGSLPWWQLLPDLRHEYVVGGYGQYTRSDYVTVAVSEDKQLLVAYLPKPGPLTVDLSKLKGPRLSVKWFNPRTGAFAEGGTLPNQGVKKLFSPLQEDWVLLLSSGE
jgi:hypothetical protein